MALEHLADHVVLNELDHRVAAVWSVVFGTDAEAFCERILTFDMTTESAAAVIALDSVETFEVAWRTLVQNRVSHGGIIAPGDGVLRHGEGGKGMLSRWYPETLARRKAPLLRSHSHCRAACRTRRSARVALLRCSRAARPPAPNVRPRTLAEHQVIAAP